MVTALLLGLAAIASGCGGESPPTMTPGGDAGVEITMSSDPDPARAGTVTLTFGIQDAAGKPVTDAGTQVHVVGDMPSMGHGGLEGDATYMGDGKWQVRGRLSMGGEWRIVVKVNRDGKLLAEREFRVQASG
ncbi:MAG: FixH family protein [Chloroflexia bacterium]